ncbi:MFS transporter [Azoarcus sp. L1K30]|uniref:MFS transporter n=1 Tax=Azoarcus sp. L1K30 TaxID=2820277 RepID=UPI001B81CD88|nr:MFS transporter [Azoarcus sp. L1K30]MBR0565423.1 MFS transporter [Azoarcus sp. L1K30]
MKRNLVGDRNAQLFVRFRVLFNSRFYYPVLAILFLDLGLSAEQYTLLNFVWAITIVVAEVPSGVLADRIGRRPLVIAASAFMVAEMLVLAAAPQNGGLLLFLFCLLNRMLSGLAEALASGADESLAFDALAAEGRQGEWPNVLARLMRWQATGMVVAMLVGSAVYDPALMSRAAMLIGLPLQFDLSTTLRFPIYINLLTAACVLLISLRMVEPARPDPHSMPSTRDAIRSVADTARWIAGNPLVLFVIIGGLLIDSVIRVFLTFASAYYRMIDLPEASFGLIGASLAGIGILVSPLARQLVLTGSLLRTYALLALVALFGLGGVALDVVHWGVVFTLPLAAAIAAVGFAVSHYLNLAVESRHRATVLSFKGLAFNLGYGFASLLFAMALRAYRDTGSAHEGLAGALGLLPVWLGFTAAVLMWVFRRHRKTLLIQA